MQEDSKRAAGRPSFIPKEVFRQYLTSTGINKFARIGGMLPSSFVSRCCRDGRPIRSVHARHRLLDIVARANAELLPVTLPEEAEVKRQIEDLRIELKQLTAEAASIKHKIALENSSISMTGATLLTEHEIVAAKSKTAPLCGVYFLIYGETIVYVGQSVNILKRISDHAAAKQFDSYSFITAEPGMLNVLESLYIHALRPPLNGKWNSSIGMHAPIRLDTLLRQATA